KTSSSRTTWLDICLYSQRCIIHHYDHPSVLMKGNNVHVSLRWSQQVQDLNIAWITMEFPYIFEENNASEVNIMR
ncbi:MAG: hypothetical protein ACJ72C_05965, partial [Nitrososphaeraceae archaeon]